MTRWNPRFWPVLITFLVLSLLSVLAIPVRASARAAPAAGSPVALGAYASGFPGSGSQLSQFEGVLGSHVAIASSFRGWGDIFPDAAQLPDAQSGHTLLVAWDMGATADTRYSTFPAHAHDAYLSEEAAAAKAFGAPFYVRPWAEMNGDWNPFQPTTAGEKPAGGTYAQFIAAWRYLVTFFRQHGATNVRWVFNPTTDTYAGTTTVAKIWPGAAYVDVMGLDGYNWGAGGVFTWRTFADIYTTQYKRLVALSSTLPVWVCEFGSKEPSENDGAPVDTTHHKSTWYSGMVSSLSSMPQVRALVMFEVQKERDWRIESDPQALATVRGLAATARPTAG